VWKFAIVSPQARFGAVLGAHTLGVRLSSGKTRALYPDMKKRLA
jgi:hypothetical protein